MVQEDNGATRKRERSNRYPGRSLAESIELARFLEEKGLDGLPAAEIATSLGYSNVKTNAFSARLSAARQFGLVAIKDEGYAITPLARSILHPVDVLELPGLYRKALLESPLYSELANRLADKKVPEASILANVLYHQHQIIATAKLQAAEMFLESARFAGALGDDGVFRTRGQETEPAAPASVPTPSLRTNAKPEKADRQSGDVRIDLRLWGEDQGKAIRMRVPETITAESFDRFLQVLKLNVKVVDESESRPG